MIFGHFIDFGHFPIEIPIEAKKNYRQQKEGSYIKNKNCFENRRPNGTTWNHVEIKIPNCQNKNHPTETEILFHKYTEENRESRKGKTYQSDSWTKNTNDKRH